MSSNIEVLPSASFPLRLASANLNLIADHDLDMARCKPARALKITVPRHNAQRLGPSLTGAVKTVCNEDNVIIDLPPPVQEQPSSAGPSSVRVNSWSFPFAVGSYIIAFCM